MPKATLLIALPLAMAFVAGMLIPIQAASGGTLGRVLGSPLWGAAGALSIGVVAILLMALVLRLPLPSLPDVVRGPWWMWIGGITGAIYVVTSVALIPRTGAALFMVCVIAGQMVAALVLDHFGLLGLTAKPATWGRVIGIGVIFVGIAITQVFGTNTAAAREIKAPEAAANPGTSR